MTALIVLASGTSSRFEAGNKLLASLQGKPVIKHVIDATTGYDFGGRYAVTADDKLSNIFTQAGFTIIHNPAPEAGQGVSLSFGVKAAIKDGFDSALIMLGDMPFVGRIHIQALLNIDGDIVMSEHDGIRMPPSVFRGQALKNLANLFGDHGGKVAINHANVKTLPLSQNSARDIDTLKDLEELDGS